MFLKFQVGKTAVLSEKRRHDRLPSCNLQREFFDDTPRNTNNKFAFVVIVAYIPQNKIENHKHSWKSLLRRKMH